MSGSRDLLRDIPKVDELLMRPELAGTDLPRVLLVAAVRGVLDALRADILAGAVTDVPPPGELCTRALGLATAKHRPHLRRVINATGVVLHTNLGRARMAQAALEQVAEVCGGYSNLEYELSTGARGSRYSHVEALLCELTGAEAAVVVNNNAAAVLILLALLPEGGEVILSRGEMVEIGGSFRVPEIMEQSGCVLREVGTTNKTHLRDYKNAVNPATAAILKVHPSNFRTVGFTHEVELTELVELGAQLGLPVFYDLGSGALYDIEKLGLMDEPGVIKTVAAGVDVVTFSGDKLLGGPQAGFLIGKKAWIDKVKKHPLMRALRVDKLVLAALEGTLRQYLSPDVVATIPTLAMLAATPAELRVRAQALLECLASHGVCELADVQVTDLYSQVGGGSVPGQELASAGVSLAPHNMGLEALEAALRGCEVPLVGRVQRDMLLLDVRTIADEEFETVAKNLAACLA